MVSAVAKRTALMALLDVSISGADMVLQKVVRLEWMGRGHAMLRIKSAPRRIRVYDLIQIQCAGQLNRLI